MSWSAKVGQPSGDSIALECSSERSCGELERGTGRADDAAHRQEAVHLIAHVQTVTATSLSSRTRAYSASSSRNGS